MSRHFRTFDPATGNDSLLPESSLPGGGNVSDGDELFSGLTLPASGFKIADSSGNHTLTLGVSGNVTANQSISFVDPGGNVTIDLSHFAGDTFTPTATLGNATNGNVSTANTTLNPLVDGSGNKLCFYANPNRRYGFQTFIPWKGPFSSDGFKISVSGPASPNVVWYAFTTPVTTGGVHASIAATAFGTTLTQAGGVNMGSGWPVMELKGFLDNGSTGGNVTVEHASEVGSNTTFYAGAFMVVHELP